jgi:SET domain-containing protein
MNMLLVKTYLDKSAIHGLGVFAGEVIRKGAKVWRFVD